jgi:putative protein kinase ArgK-like GTPase of G3E family
MPGTLSLTFMVGATLNTNHNKTVNRVQSDFKGLGKSVRDLSSQTKMLDKFGKSCESFLKAATDVRETTTRSGELEAKRKKQALDWMWSLIETGLHQLFKSHPQGEGALPPHTLPAGE